MRYSINLRMKNPGPAKFLIETCEANDLPSAFEAGDRMISALNVEEHFIEILDNNGDKVASFNEEN